MLPLASCGLGGPCRAGKGLLLALGADPVLLGGGPLAARSVVLGTPGTAQFPLWIPILSLLSFG